MFVSLLYSILHGFLFSYGVLALQTVPLEKKKQLVLFFSSSLYLFLTDLFLISPSCTLLVYGLIFAAFSARPVSQVLASSMAGIFLVSCIYQCGFFLFDLFPVSGIWELLADLGCALVSLLLLCRFGRYLRSISAPSGIFLPAPLCRLLFCWFILGKVLLYAPAFWVPCLLILLTAVSFLLFGRLLKLQYQLLKQEDETRSLQTLTCYTENLEQSNLQLRKFKHDYANILSTLSGYIEQGNLLGLKAYFEEQIQPMSSQMQLTSFDASALSAVQIPEVKSLLITKVLSEKARSLKVKLQIASPISWMVMDTGDFCRILGIYLDNAIEGAALSEKKELEISLDDSHEGHSLVILNSCDDTALPMDKLDRTDFSTKGEGHGMGLATVSEILKKHPYVYRRTLCKDGYFIQQLDNF